MVFSIATHTILFVCTPLHHSLEVLTFVYRRKGLKSRQTWASFILITVSFTLTPLYWSTWMAGIATEIRGVLVQNPGMTLVEKFALFNEKLDLLWRLQVFSGNFQVLTPICRPLRCLKGILFPFSSRFLMIL